MKAGNTGEEAGLGLMWCIVHENGLRILATKAKRRIVALSITSQWKLRAGAANCMLV